MQRGRACRPPRLHWQSAILRQVDEDVVVVRIELVQLLDLAVIEHAHELTLMAGETLPARQFGRGLKSATVSPAPDTGYEQVRRCRRLTTGCSASRLKCGIELSPKNNSVHHIDQSRPAFGLCGCTGRR